MRIRFLTSTPLDISRGSGTYVGIAVLARAVGELGHEVVIETPRTHLPVYTAERLLFNRGFRPSTGFDRTIGFDMDGYRIATEAGHIAALKGVIADEVRFERGWTRLTMAVQARCERLHVLRAARVIVTSRYCAAQVRALYGASREPAVVPELIDLAEWRAALAAGGAQDQAGRFVVLFVGRLYRRKRVEVLLRAADALRGRIPELEVRIVGNGPCAAPLRQLAAELQLEGAVTFLGDVSRGQLVDAYRAASVFCLPSVQEGFGIVLLEAMAAAKPMVASRAAAIPEVAPHATLVEPDNPEALAAGIELLYRSPAIRASQSLEGAARVEQFDAPRVARLFCEAMDETGPLFRRL
ncbi:MAG: glycosyltransferase family 4 protein [Bryobacteraceae bacterium]